MLNDVLRRARAGAAVIVHCDVKFQLVVALERPRTDRVLVRSSAVGQNSTTKTMAGDSLTIRSMPRMTSGSKPWTSIFTTSNVRRANSSSAGITGTTRSYRLSGVRVPTRESPGFIGWRRHREQTPRVAEGNVVGPGMDVVGPQVRLQQAVEHRVGLDRVDLDVIGESVYKQAEVPDIRAHVEETSLGAKQPAEKGGRGFLPCLAPQDVRTHDLVTRLHPERSELGLDLLEWAAVVYRWRNGRPTRHRPSCRAPNSFARQSERHPRSSASQKTRSR